MAFQWGNSVLFVKKYFFVLLLIPWNLFSQGINNIWLSGYNCGNVSECGISQINFLSGSPDTTHVPFGMNFLDCNANISDASGNLLFYTNGVYIANANNDTMLNGSGLNPSTYTSQFYSQGLRVRQGNLILPLPGDSLRYYLFHETLFFDQSVNDYRSSEIYFSVIDMGLDGGLGAVTQKNIVLLSDTLNPGALTACKHANGRDWWIVFHKSKGNRYYTYLFTPSGLQGPFAQHIGHSIASNDWIWQSCFSPDGKKFSVVMARDTINFMEFDRCSGLFSNPVSICIKDSANGRGVAISSNSQYAYVSSMNYVYQYDLNATNIDSSKYLVAKFDGYADIIPPFYTTFYLAQLAVDRKIYITTGNGTRWFNVINDPDLPGRNCNFLQHGFQLPTYNAYTIPNFPYFSLGSETGTVCDSLPSIGSRNDASSLFKKSPQIWPDSSIGYESKGGNKNEIIYDEGYFRLKDLMNNKLFYTKSILDYSKQ